MPRFIKKPLEISAILFTGDYNAVNEEFPDCLLKKTSVASSLYDAGFNTCVWISVEEQWVGVAEGQWIIQGVKGEYYPCDDDVFRATYDEVN